jgi:hypothetical protein
MIESHDAQPDNAYLGYILGGRDFGGFEYVEYVVARDYQNGRQVTFSSESPLKRPVMHPRLTQMIRVLSKTAF